MSTAPSCPFAPGEQAPNLLRQGYLFISNLRKKAGLAPESNLPVRTRMMLKPATIVRGSLGVELFYDTDRMKRDGGMPAVIRGPLFGHNAVHTLDGQEHRVRKHQLADVAYDDSQVGTFDVLVKEEIDKIVSGWARAEGTVYEGAALSFGRAAFRWAGIELSPKEADRRALQMANLVYEFGHPVKGHVSSWINRYKLDKWAEKLIEETRSGERHTEEGTALHAMAHLTGPDGELVDARTAGIDLQNLTRPTVAVSLFASFAAGALVDHPEWIEKIRDGGEPVALAVAQEVRRLYPFVPMLPAVAITDTEIQGCPVRKDERVIIDVYGTNTDPNEWENPSSFSPDRFLSRDDLKSQADYERITAFIPQGGADVYTGHRCPGEKIAVSALTSMVMALCQPDVVLSTDPSDIRFPWTKMLTRSETGMRVRVQQSN